MVARDHETYAFTEQHDYDISHWNYWHQMSILS
jgi:hypothetical protein